jgi:hypothetical protein
MGEIAMTRNPAVSNTAKRATSPQPTTLQEVEKAKLLMQLQAELTGWAKSRLWVISIVGVLGAWAAFQATVSSMIRASLDKPIENALKSMQSEIQEVEAQKDEATRAIIELKESRNSVEEAARKQLSAVQDAQKRVDDTMSDINLLQARLDKMKTDVDEQVGRMKEVAADNLRIKDNSIGLYAGTFELRSDRVVDDLRFKLRMRALDEVIDRITTWLDRPPAVDAANEGVPAIARQRSLTEEAKLLRDDYRSSEQRLLGNSALKVVLYIRKGGGFYDTAEKASEALKDLGYRTDIWYANGDTAAEAVNDISTDFPGSKQLLRQYMAGVISAPSEEQHGQEVIDVLQRYSLFSKVHFAKSELKPDERHLKRGLDKPYGEDQIILVYVLSEPSDPSTL